MAPSHEGPPEEGHQREDRPAVSHEGGAPVEFDLSPLRSFDPAGMSVEPVEPVDSMFGRFGGRCFVLRGALTPSECEYLVEKMSAGPSLEPVSYRHEYRQTDRCVFESSALAEILWERVRIAAEGLAIHADPKDCRRQQLFGGSEDAGTEGTDCPDELRLPYGCGGTWQPFGLNECFRFCRYRPGGFFRAHCDATFRRNDEEMSLFTCMFYLDGGFDGGATNFLKIDGVLTDQNYLKPAEPEQVLAKLVPEAGMCILFFQPGLLHEGEDLLSGVKHLLRTDVMFRREPGSGPQRTPQEEEAWSLVREAQTAEANGECDRAVSLYRRAFKLDPALERTL